MCCACYIDVCKGHHQQCDNTQIKQVLLMRVKDEDLVQRLISLDASCTLQDLVMERRFYETARSHNSKAGSHTATPPPSTLCNSCGKQHGSHSYLAAEAVRNNCGRKRH